MTKPIRDPRDLSSDVSEFPRLPSVPPLDYVVQHLAARTPQASQQVRVERRPDLAVSPIPPEWPADLRELAILCGQAYNLFVRLDDYAVDYAETHDMGDRYADWYAHALNAYYRWRDLERDAQAAVAAWERRRETDSGDSDALTASTGVQSPSTGRDGSQGNGGSGVNSWTGGNRRVNR